MASTRDYLEYLNQKIDIAPVNSEEEYQAAGLIESLMQSHGLETRLQDFEAPGLGRLPYYIVGIVMFIAVFLTGLHGTIAAIVGEILMLICLALLGVRYLGFADPLGNMGRKVNSQNVIGVHRATGPLVTKGSRPIVIVAHYDTPRENLLFAAPFDRWQRLLRKWTPQFVCAAALLALIQVFGFMPSGIRHLLWVFGLVAALPMLLVGIAAIQERFAPCTEGSNDNKSGVAAMLGVMAQVHPGDDDATGFGKQRELRDEENAKRLAEQAETEAAAAAALVPIEEGAEVVTDAAEVNALLDEVDIETSDGDDALFENAPALKLVEDEMDEMEPDDIFEPTDVSPEDDVSKVSADADGENEVMVDLQDAPESAEVNPYESEEDEPEELLPQIVTRHEIQVERIEGVRHGKETLEALHILPAECEIVYIEPQTQSFTYEETVSAPDPDDLYEDEYDSYGEYYDDDYQDGGWDDSEYEPQAGILDGVAGFFARAREGISGFIARRREQAANKTADSPSDLSETQTPEDGLVDFDTDAPQPEAYQDISTEDSNDIVDAAEAEAASISEEDLLLDEVYAVVDGDSDELTPTGTLSLVEDDQVSDTDGTLTFVPQGELIDGREVDYMGDTKDSRGLTEYTADATLISETSADIKPSPAPIDDPSWGKSSYTPSVSNVARRAVLFDLPDPMGATGANDPLVGSLDTPQDSVDAGATVIMTELPDAALDNEAPTNTNSSNAAPITAPQGNQDPNSFGAWLGVGDNFDARTEGNAIGSWDNFVDAPDEYTHEDDWKGGAARRGDLREVDDDDVRVQEDLREAILGLGDDELVAHDIWFVALGGSYADHAGIKAFLDNNRTSVRGCFLINLDCVGSGTLSMLTNEGLVGTRRADRRIVRMLSKIAEDLHINLPRLQHDWEDTDATYAMRKALRSVTLCGLTPDGALALSQVADDEPDMVDPAQTALVTDMVAELIRRS